VYLLSAALPHALRDRLEGEEVPVLSLVTEPGSEADAAETIDVARQCGSSWIVLDGYHFDAVYQQRIKDAGLKLLYIDDCGYAGHYSADIVLNQNIFANAELYQSRERYTQLLLGTHYALLRREFRDWHNWQREIPPVARKLLVTLGGSDPDNVTLKVLEALQQVDTEPLEVVVLVGAGNPHYATLQSVMSSGPHVITLQNNVRNMPELIAWADVVISAGGSTCWELAFLGVPMLLLVLADNQRPIAEHLHHNSVAHNFGWHSDVTSTKIVEGLRDLLLSVTTRTKMCREGRKLVDGFGAERAIDCITKLSD
jgi:UDP-2,4-diacetamido-2,4,6-trideoxy-beta-L-altropyranose hydrolase